MYTIEAISRIISTAQVCLALPTQDIHFLVYDSRKITYAAQSLFFALQGARDGHQYLHDAYQQGVRSFVVSNTKHIEQMGFEDINLLVVEDVLAALQQLAAHQRRTFTKPLIAITGSNGKTVVKAWLVQLLGPDMKVYQSPKSYNSQLGVALSLWNLSNDYDLAIIEAGISTKGEMSPLAAMIAPTIGVFTHLGVAHAEGFASKLEKREEKLLLFAGATAVIADAQIGLSQVEGASWMLQDWGPAVEASLQIEEVHQGEDFTTLHLRYGQQRAAVRLPFHDQASLSNAMSCMLLLLYLGYSMADIAVRVQQLKPVEMRLQLKNGKQRCSIIDDSYSNDMGSLQIALEFLALQQQHPSRYLILSDMAGLFAEATLPEKLVRLLNNSALTQVLLVGASLPALASQLNMPTSSYSSTEDLISALPSLNMHDASILIKGSRHFRFEDVVAHLVAKSHGTVMSINLKAIEGNVQAYRSLLAPQVKVMAMVKAFSYGSGSFEIANLLQFNRVDYLTVAFADEGVELRQGGVTLPIMVLSPDESTFETLLAFNLEPEIYSFRILHAFKSFLKGRRESPFPIHIKVDTGMHRLGFLPSEQPSLAALLLSDKQLAVQSIFSHLVASGDQQQDNFTQQQIDKFSSFAAALEAALGYSVIKHIANTSAIVRWPAAHMDMVRLGIGLYGVDMDHGAMPLEEVSTLKTTITQIKTLDTSETIGYDRAGVLARTSTIATVKIGYADGYRREFGHGVGKMMVHGHLVPTVGKICMDMCMLDITGVDAQEDDEVLVYPSLMEAATAVGTIPYELLVNISTRVKRVYYYD